MVALIGETLIQEEATKTEEKYVGWREALGLLGARHKSLLTNLFRAGRLRRRKGENGTLEFLVEDLQTEAVARSTAKKELAKNSDSDGKWVPPKAAQRILAPSGGYANLTSYWQNKKLRRKKAPDGTNLYLVEDLYAIKHKRHLKENRTAKRATKRGRTEIELINEHLHRQQGAAPDELTEEYWTSMVAKFPNLAEIRIRDGQLELEQRQITRIVLNKGRGQ